MSEELIRVVTSFPHAGEPGCKIKLSSFESEIEEPCVELECDSGVSDALIEQGSGLLYIVEKYYCDSKVEIDPNLTKQASVGKLDAQAKQRAEIKTALKTVLPAVRAGWKKLGLKYSRQQLLESLVPAAGKKCVGKELAEAGNRSRNRRPAQQRRKLLRIR